MIYCFILILTKIFLGFLLSFLTNFKAPLLYSNSSLLKFNIDLIINHINSAFIISYHCYLAISLFIKSITLTNININKPKIFILFNFILISSNLQLIISLIIFSLNLTLFAHHSYIVPVYLFMSNDYTTLFSLFCYHINISSILILGSGTYAFIYIIRDYYKIQVLKETLTEIISYYCIIINYSIYASIFTSLHSFGLYIHNDTIQALGRLEDLFSDNSIQLKPTFAIWIQNFKLINIDLNTLNFKVISLTQELGTADFLIHHIHAFNIHVTLLILLKGVLYSRTSRLISDKIELGWRYPCDGPGRGGTYQVSPYDHIYSLY